MKVLVTGGGTGIGRAVAEKVIQNDGQVVVVGRRTEVLEDFVRKYPGKAHCVVADVADAQQRDGLVSLARRILGGLDGFVHSAGVVYHQLPGEISDEAIEAQLQVNLIAPLRLGEEALEVLSEGGSMVFMGSTLSQRPVASSAVYSAAKAGLSAVMKVLALQGAKHGIRANAVLPGIVETDMVADRLKSHGEEMKALHILGRLGQPEDVAQTVWHLLNAPWTTGTEVVVDGGLLLRE